MRYKKTRVEIQSACWDRLLATAALHGGKVLTESYLGGLVPHRFRCSIGHEWEANPRNITGKSKTWCPTCAMKRSERSVRQVFESLFNEVFPQTKPSWLRNKIGNRMELDGYSQTLQLAFEYQGEHHYNVVPGWRHDEEKLAQRQEDDALKVSICAAVGVHLVVIPWTVKLEDIPLFILRDISSNQVLVDRLVQSAAEMNHVWDKEAELTRENGPQAWVEPAWADPEDMMQRLHDAAERNKGVCLDVSYRGARAKYRFQCHHGHTWSTEFHNVGGRHKRWCPVCAGVRAVPEKQMEKLNQKAMDKKGVCLDTEYRGSQTKYRFRCHQNHEFEAYFGNVMKGTWCPMCSGHGLTKTEQMTRLTKIVDQKNGQLIDPEPFTGPTQKYRVRCQHGHSWETTAGALMKTKGTWCPECANVRRGIKKSRNVEAVSCL